MLIAVNLFNQIFDANSGSTRFVYQKIIFYIYIVITMSIIKDRQYRLFLYLWVFVSIADFCLELFLLNKKYDVFSGGFLQAYQIKGTAGITLFILVFLAINLLFYGFITLMWYSLSRRLGLRVLSSAYHFIWIIFGLTLFFVAVRYQLHNYFGDYLTFFIVKNLGGGSVIDAMIYSINEGLGLIAAVGALILAWFIGARFVRSRFAARNVILKGKISFWLILSCMAGLAVMMMIANMNLNYRHHLRRTTSYMTMDLAVGWLISPRQGPLALDIPDNGIDEDGLAGDFHYVAPSEAVSYVYPGNKKNIILIVLESVRGDALTSEVNGRVVAPNMRALAAEGTYSDRYYSHTGYTTSSLTAIFTGSLDDHSRPFLLPVLKENGYGISAISGQNEVFGQIELRTGVREYADFFFDSTNAPEKRVFFAAVPGSLKISDHEVFTQFEKRAEAVDWSQPQFFYLNLQAPHFPYYYEGMPKLLIDNPLPRSEIKPENQKRLHETYWNSVAVADQTIGWVIKFLKQKGLYENTIIVVVGDHGESLFDNGLLGHGMQISDEQLRAVFVSNRRWPVNQLMGHIDLGNFILTGSGAEAKPAVSMEPKPVFHFVGPLNTPNYVGFTMPDGRKLIFDVGEQTYQVENKSEVEVMRKEALEKNQTLRSSFDDLIHEWERVRWEDHLKKEAGQVSFSVE